MQTEGGNAEQREYCPGVTIIVFHRISVVNNTKGLAQDKELTGPRETSYMQSGLAMDGTQIFASERP